MFESVCLLGKSGAGRLAGQAFRKGGEQQMLAIVPCTLAQPEDAAFA